MSEQEQTAQQAWHALETFWSPFSFLLAPGATPEQIDAWQKKEGVTLQPDVGALIGVHGAFGVPASVYTDFSAEVTLSAIDQWIRFDRSILNEVDPDFWPEIFKDHNCPSTSMEDTPLSNAIASAIKPDWLMRSHPLVNAIAPRLNPIE